MTTLHSRIASSKRQATLRRALFSGAAIVAFAALPQAALAQDEDQVDSEEAADDDEYGDRVILVQARKQTETLQEVPVTITSVSGELLEKYGVDLVKVLYIEIVEVERLHRTIADGVLAEVHKDAPSFLPSRR